MTDDSFYNSLSDDQRQAIEKFVKLVNAGAEKTMMKTGVLEGAHHASIERELRKMRYPDGIVRGWADWHALDHAGEKPAP